MKRLFLGLAVLLALSTGRGLAEFVTIKIDLNRFTVGAGVQPGKAPNPPPNADPGLPPIWAYANLPLKQRTNMKGYAILEHQWGLTNIPVAYLLPKGAMEFELRDVPPLKKQFAERVNRVKKEGKDRLRLLALAEWALKHGLHSEFETKMKELAVLEPKHPVVTALAQVQQEMKSAPASDDPAAAVLMHDFKMEGYQAVASDKHHYVLLTKLRTDDPAVKDRLDRLEKNYTNFFYWFAFKGKALPLPKYRLAVVLENTPKELLSRNAAFDYPPMVADGFTIRRDNVIVMCAKRLDDVYDLLEKNNQADWQNIGLNKEVLFNGVIPNPRTGFKPLDVMVLQTRALVQRAMEEESVRATATHEGTRQLLSATGLLPRNVAAGEWVRFGLASFFETPYHAFYPGTGLPSWTNLIAFKYLRKTGKLSPEQGKEIVLHTITDSYFHKAYGLQALAAEGKETKEALEPRAQRALEMARATSWALIYHLMSLDGYTETSKEGAKSENLDRLLNYLRQLSDLPRDVEYDASVLQGCFGRAFGMLKNDAAPPNALDRDKLQRLARACFDTMENTVLEVRGVEEEALRQRSQPSAK